MGAAAKLTRQDIEPEDDESEDDFMERCTDEIGDEDVCQIIWDNRAADNIRHKTHEGKEDGLEFVLSDETPDRMDDVIMADGWELANFKKNPIALFGHRSDFPIGRWSNIRVVDNQLRGYLDLAPKGTSQRIDELRALLDADILRAVSVGFRPIETKPRKESDWGVFFTKAELVECSLVSVPANPNALAVAKSLKISPATIDLIFAGHGREGGIARRRASPAGKPTSSRHTRKGTTMSSFAQRITAIEQRVNMLRDQLKDHWAKADDTNVSDEQLGTANELTEQLTQAERTLASLRDAERHLGETADDGGSRAIVVAARGSTSPAAIAAASGHTTGLDLTRPFALPRKKVDPLELLVHCGVAQLFAHNKRQPIEMTMREIYGDDELHRAAVTWITRAATAPATTTTVGWAAELAQTTYAAYMDLLYAASVYPRLAGMGLSLSFGTAGKIIIPTRATTPTIAGSFVGEGLPIPVRQGLFTSQTLTPKKMAVITTFTREISEHSVPAIEGLLRDAIQNDTAISLDSVLLDANPATVVRPAGILNGVSGLTPTAGGGFTALVGDIKQISGALLTGTKGNIRNPAWIMNPQQVNSAGLVAAPGAGVFPFRDEVSQGRLGGWPIINSGTVPLGTVIAMDAADFVAVGGEAPRFEISDQATLHLEDTTPLDIGTAGTPPVVAAPVKSMFQTDSLALRLVLPTNWTVRRAGVVAWVAGVTW
jgi:HK97 family phage prohead protease